MGTHIEDLVTEKIEKIKNKENIFDSGTVIKVKDYIIEVSGLENVTYFEKVNIWEKGMGYVNQINENSVNVAIVKQNAPIEVGDIVYDEKGFIGTVSLVDEHHSTVKLVTNKDTQLSVRINNSYGILQREHEDLVVTSITSKEQIQEGDIVYTSSFSVVGLEIPVGTVTEVESNGIEQKVKVKPTTDISNLNYVLIRKKNTHV